MTEIKLDAKALEATATELLAHGEFSSIPGNNAPNARIAAHAAIRTYLAALPDPTPAERGAVEANRFVECQQCHALLLYHEPEALPPAPAAGVSEALVEQLTPEQIADHLGVTPYSDIRPFVVHAVKYAREKDSALLAQEAHRPEPSARQEEAAVIGKEAGGAVEWQYVPPKEFSDETKAALKAIDDAQAATAVALAYRPPIVGGAARCRSSIYPCSWQRHNGMDSVCPTCIAATAPLTPGGQADGQ